MTNIRGTTSLARRLSTDSRRRKPTCPSLRRRRCRASRSPSASGRPRLSSMIRRSCAGAGGNHRDETILETEVVHAAGELSRCGGRATPATSPPRQPLPRSRDATARAANVEHPDSQPTGIGADLVDERSRERWRDVGISGLVTGDRVQHCRCVSHAARDATVDGRAGPRLTDQRRLTDTALARLQAHQSALRRRHADGTTAIVGMSNGDNACADRGGRAARGSTGGVVEVPRISRRTVGQGSVDVLP
jgi:hypothetical protein